MPQLETAWFASQLFWLVAGFSLMYFLMAHLILPPLMEIMEKRKATTERDLGSAQSLKSQAEHAREHYERTLLDARTRSQQLIDEAMQAHKDEAEKAGKALDAEIATKLAEAEKKIRAGKQALMDALTPTTTEMTALIVEKLTQRAPSPDKVRSIINEFSKGSR